MQMEVTINAPALVQQFTHLAHPNRVYRFSHLFGKMATTQE